MAEKVVIIYSVVDEATTKLGKIAKGVKGIGTSSKTAGKAVGGLGPIAKTAASMITAYLAIEATRAVTTFAKESVQAFADFEYAMADVAAKLGTSIGDVIELSETARRVGVEYGIGAQEAAKGLKSFAAAGFDAAESAVALESATMLAIVAGTSMEQATLLIVQSLSVFGAEADEATKYVDALVAADLASTAAASDLALSLGYAGASAKSMGLDVYDTLTAVAALSDRVGGAAKAGRYFDALLRELRMKSKDLGIEIYKTDGSLKDFGDIITEVAGKMEGLTVEQRNAWLTSIGFSSQAQRALLTLAGMGDGAEETAEMWAELNSEIHETGRASEAVATKIDTLTGSTNKFAAAMEDLKIAVIEDWAPEIKVVLDKTTEFVRALTWMIRNPMPDVTMRFGKKGMVEWAAAYDEFLDSIKETETATDIAGDAIDNLADNIDSLASIARPIETTVDEINRLIREGLINEAQGKFAEFTDCVTNKSGQMALGIQDDIWDLIVSTEEGYARLLSMAEQMPVGPEREAAMAKAAEYREAGYGRIEALESILDTLLTGDFVPGNIVATDLGTTGDISIDIDINIGGISDDVDVGDLGETVGDSIVEKLVDAGVIK